jgi:hypothetical protein
MADETKWSPEPWSIDETDRTIVDAKDSAVVVADDYALDWTAWGPDSRRRIVAAVNSVAGIPSEALESGALGKAIDALLKYHRENRLKHDADAERYELSEAALVALGRIAP